MQKRQQAKEAKAEWDKAAAENKTKSDSFLAQNKAKTGVKVLPSGVQYRVIETGTGAKPTQASTVQLEVAGPYLGRRASAAGASGADRSRPSRSARSSCRRCAKRCCRCRPVRSGKSCCRRTRPTAPTRARGFPPNVAVEFDVKLVSVK